MMQRGRSDGVTWGRGKNKETRRAKMQPYRKPGDVILPLGAAGGGAARLASAEQQL